ncbi:LCP family glycopolymer transferase [Nocardiopsis kunsanensis]|uniref:LCP family glycopolymer transferase n=1 Tax=Nocardiopsis kunsanensis TaxID=141693 RepID=UPI000345ECF3|nr:LCP family protein [Nocardiopsis kunsanensis]
MAADDNPINEPGPDGQADHDPPGHDDHPSPAPPDPDDTPTTEHSSQDPTENAAEGDTDPADPDDTPTTDGSSESAPATEGGAAGKPRRSRWRKVLLWTAASLVLAMVALVGGAYAYYQSLRSDMDQHDIDSVLVEEDRPDKLDDAVNILFIGSDGYEEDSPAYSSEFEGERSDSLMLAHISPDDRASVVSFPRDSLVQLPECEPYGDTEGTSSYHGMLNAAMYHGGPPCVVHTIESLTEIRVDHFVHLSFASFRDVVDAIGGVEMCIPEPMEDERSDLDIDEGEQVLDGETALSFVRARYEIGDGGDIGRIDRQQMFLAALAEQVMSNEVLTDPRKMNGLAGAVAEHSATDRELTLDRMVSVAFTLSGVDLSDIEFHTVPWFQAPHNPNRVIWNEEEAEKLFTAVREGRPLPELMAADDASVPKEPPGTEPSEAASPEPSAEPSDSPPALPGEGRDATSDPCEDGLGLGTGEEDG